MTPGAHRHPDQNNLSLVSWIGFTRNQPEVLSFSGLIVGRPATTHIRKNQILKVDRLITHVIRLYWWHICRTCHTHPIEIVIKPVETCSIRNLETNNLKVLQFISEKVVCKNAFHTTLYAKKSCIHFAV